MSQRLKKALLLWLHDRNRFQGLCKRVIDLVFKFFAALATKRVHSEGSVVCRLQLGTDYNLLLVRLQETTSSWSLKYGPIAHNTNGTEICVRGAFRYDIGDFTGRSPKCAVDNLAKIDLCKLARTKGDYDEPCQILSCDQAGRAVVVISYSDGAPRSETIAPSTRAKT